MEREAYQIEYDAFVQGYKLGQVSGEQVGETIMKMVQYYGDQNSSLAAREILSNKKAAENVELVDEATGKQITVSKAETLTKASQEYSAFLTARVHLQNIEQCINALKALQKGVLNEYSHMGGV
ncbi:MAG: hypothetical protein WC783_05965 [Candidatus Paceibacterota bacterium]|jgi:hypothetical protein